MRILLALLLISFAAKAENEGIMSRLFAPGPLIKGHATLEGSQCLKCHETGQGVPDSKCLDCHKDIKAFVGKKSGFHGMQTESCFKCHSDHKGRDFDSTKFDFKSFDHKKTGFSLEGKHSKLDCAKCHEAKRGADRIRPHDLKFVGSTATCVSCHKKEDIHFFKGNWAKQDCNACHGVESWKTNLKFDHKRDAKFELIGSHAKLKCQDCHTPSKTLGRPALKGHSIYKWPNLKQAECLSCHQNFHAETLSPRFRNGKCATCHEQTTWKIQSFDHATTKYPLQGKHAELKCMDCHKQKGAVPTIAYSGKRAMNVKWHGLNKSCTSCHQDVHLFGKFTSNVTRQPNACVGCHSESSWKDIQGFNHSAHTRFKIDGEHKGLKCADCHIPQRARWNSKTMLPVPAAQKNSKVGVYHWNRLTQESCATCHKNVHIGVFSKQQLAKKCSECHVTDGWKVVKTGKGFDHSKTRFPLTGKHREASCTNCHVKGNKQVFTWNSTDKGFCIECHDNVHNRQFSQKFASQSCSECHSTDSFVKRPPFNHDLTRYSLNGAHKRLNCSECHTPTREVFPVKPPKWKSLFVFPALNESKCLTCHKDIHAGQLGKDCASCHTEERWKLPKFDHQTHSKFPLRGSHRELKCQSCHQALPGRFVREAKREVPVIHYKPINDACTTCHKDAHGGQLGSDCAKCHTEEKWKKTGFNHQLHSKFALKGKHEDLKCNECHKNVSGKSVREFGRQIAVLHYKPIGTQCSTCHKDPHKGNFGAQCVSCHRETGWETTRDFHRSFTLTGVHFSLQCTECHSQGKKLTGLSQQCIYCHKKDDIHSGTLPNCGDCHRQHFWENARFNHSMTSFPLRGAHRVIQCQECHSRGIYQGLSTACASCHLQDAQRATSVSHTPISNFMNCTDCHRNQFSFR